ncbi:deoxyribodipyrimidine photo-lyase [Gammaproteobacteria bacterium]|nr:deoxyribodipyrimidine photo-lyase [Gammaproteobacteria bacterium]
MSIKQDIHIVWYKRNLRVDDHAPMREAAADGVPVLPLYVVEPHYWQQKFSSRRHWYFIYDCLVELRHQTKKLGQPLAVNERSANKAVKKDVFCSTSFWGGYATLLQNYVPQKSPLTAALTDITTFKIKFKNGICIYKLLN